MSNPRKRPLVVSTQHQRNRNYIHDTTASLSRPTTPTTPWTSTSSSSSSSSIHIISSPYNIPSSLPSSTMRATASPSYHSRIQPASSRVSCSSRLSNSIPPPSIPRKSLQRIYARRLAGLSPPEATSAPKLQALGRPTSHLSRSVSTQSLRDFTSEPYKPKSTSHTHSVSASSLRIPHDEWVEAGAQENVGRSGKRFVQKMRNSLNLKNIAPVAVSRRRGHTTSGNVASFELSNETCPPAISHPPEHEYMFAGCVNVWEGNTDSEMMDDDEIENLIQACSQDRWSNDRLPVSLPAAPEQIVSTPMLEVRTTDRHTGTLVSLLTKKGSAISPVADTRIPPTQTRLQTSISYRPTPPPGGKLTFSRIVCMGTPPRKLQPEPPFSLLSKPAILSLSVVHITLDLHPLSPRTTTPHTASTKTVTRRASSNALNSDLAPEPSPVKLFTPYTPSCTGLQQCSSTFGKAGMVASMWILMCACVGVGFVVGVGWEGTEKVARW
jgi:hypothetical protein